MLAVLESFKSEACASTTTAKIVAGGGKPDEQQATDAVPKREGAMCGAHAGSAVFGPIWQASREILTKIFPGERRKRGGAGRAFRLFVPHNHASR